MCLSLIAASSAASRSVLTVHVLAKFSPAVRPPNNTLTSTSTSTSSTTSHQNDVIAAADVTAASRLTHSVLSSCLSKSNIRNYLSPLLRIHTIDPNNHPEKGRTVWYVQQKHVQVRDCLTCTEGEGTVDYSGAQNPGVHTAMSVECLEGVLVGVHKEGFEEPFYTVSLSTPIPGNAGNTVREIQTTGYRYVNNFLLHFAMSFFLEIYFRIFIFI